MRRWIANEAVYEERDDGDDVMTTKEVIDRVFKEPGVRYELTEFENLGKPIHEVLEIRAKTATTGRDADTSGMNGR